VTSRHPSRRNDGCCSSTISKPDSSRAERLVEGSSHGSRPGSTSRRRLQNSGGPGRTIAALASVFEQLAAGGALRLDDAALAAAHFNWLIMSAPVNQAMMLGSDSIPNRRELNRYADTGVRAFLAAYRDH
jgi:hypothetical protein